MNKLIQWIKSHQVVAFFVITFLISWGLGFSMQAVLKRGEFLLAPVSIIALCGPALAGIIITALTNTQPRQGSKRAYWTAFFVAWVTCALVFLANNILINHAPLTLAIAVFTLVAVLPVAFVLSMAYSRLPAVRVYLASLLRLRGVRGWAFVALLLVPAIILLSITISSLLGRVPLTVHHFQETSLALLGLVLVKFLYQFFFFNATGEEAGWRGFALPRMQASLSPLAACLVLNIFWPLWHLFLWEAEGRPVSSLMFWGQTYLEHLLGTLTLTWVYNRSKGSILAAGIAHAAANTAFAFVPELDYTVYNWTLVGIALLMVLADRMWQKLPSDHPAVYPMSE
ncbi:MAG: hypothetical protein JW726_18720 [Anaerolineales bacterium]|nr:hypothetical protein [Anaerolineales bacterium]